MQTFDLVPSGEKFVTSIIFREKRDLGHTSTIKRKGRVDHDISDTSNTRALGVPSTKYLAGMPEEHSNQRMITLYSTEVQPDFLLINESGKYKNSIEKKCQSTNITSQMTEF